MYDFCNNYFIEKGCYRKAEGSFPPQTAMKDEG